LQNIARTYAALRGALAQNPHSDLGWFRVGVFSAQLGD
jgi:cytochrome c-type biogenesis protein CcmH/NrfG